MMMRRLSRQAAHRLSTRASRVTQPRSACTLAQWSSPLVAPVHVEARQRWTSVRYFATTTSDDDDDELLVNFEDLVGLDSRSLSSIEKMGFSKMTDIQRKSYAPIANEGKDVLARAQTGTGKTLAFLVPTIQRLVETIGVYEDKVQVLILSPTRELALQIDSQVKALTVDHEEITHQTLFGGVPKVADINAFRQRIPTILVATPGRLCDHVRNTHIEGTSFRTLLKQIDVMILDEADRYIDMGDDVTTILRAVPKKRQTLLFSATLPDSVLDFLHNSMRSDFERVDTIEGDEDQTVQIVDQSHVILPPSKMVTGTVEIIRSVIGIPETKVIVFFPTTSMVSFFAKVFNFGLGGKYVLEIHSKKTQAYRTSVSNRFRELKNEGVLFTSDVSARGVDYPGITHVIQVALPASQESYIHRLGRTGRAGSEGQGILILAETERGFLDKLNEGIDVPVNEALQGLVESDKPSRIRRALAPVMESIEEGTNETLIKAAEETYRSLLGYYNGKLGRIGVKGLPNIVEFCNTWAAEAGLQETPTIGISMAKACGLHKVPGVNLARRERSARSRARRKEKTAGYHGDDRLVGTGDYDNWGKNATADRKPTAHRAGRHAPPDKNDKKALKAALKKNLRKTSRPPPSKWFD